MQQDLKVQCPWCFEWVTLWAALDDLGVMTVDCEVCCRPWRVCVTQNPTGSLEVAVDRE
jgi:hypothetical protein